MCIGCSSIGANRSWERQQGKMVGSGIGDLRY
jgi:hypothetical protein